MRRALAVGVGTAIVGLVATTVGTSPAVAAGSYRLKVTCTVPRSQSERQLAANSCMNYLPDGTQTFTVRVRDASGRAAAGVVVRWTDSDSKDAAFRRAQNPCTTNSNGTCSAELADRKPRAGEKITVTATVGGSSARGYLTFQ